jgi:hypothetical protein
MSYEAEVTIKRSNHRANGIKMVRTAHPTMSHLSGMNTIVGVGCAVRTINDGQLPNGDDTERCAVLLVE